MTVVSTSGLIDTISISGFGTVDTSGSSALFGVSDSCTVFYTNNPPPDSYADNCCVTPGPGGTPVVPPTPLQPVDLLCAGGGVVPTAAAPAASEVWP